MLNDGAGSLLEDLRLIKTDRFGVFRYSYGVIKAVNGILFQPPRLCASMQSKCVVELTTQRPVSGTKINLIG